jgi:anti-sigma28 factor (negative regulator of flagellin synthesis)
VQHYHLGDMDKMKIITTSLVSGLMALGFSAGVALAQGTAPGTAAPGAGVTAPPAAKPASAAPKSTGVQKQASTPEGIECSAQADAQKLTGKPRVKFRKKCIADIKKAAAPGGAKPSIGTPAPAPAATKKN